MQALDEKSILCRAWAIARARKQLDDEEFTQSYTTGRTEANSPCSEILMKDGEINDLKEKLKVEQESRNKSQEELKETQFEFAQLQMNLTKSLEESTILQKKYEESQVDLKTAREELMSSKKELQDCLLIIRTFENLDADSMLLKIENERLRNDNILSNKKNVEKHNSSCFCKRYEVNSTIAMPKTLRELTRNFFKDLNLPKKYYHKVVDYVENTQVYFNKKITHLKSLLIEKQSSLSDYSSKHSIYSTDAIFKTAMLTFLAKFTEDLEDLYQTLEISSDSILFREVVKLIRGYENEVDVPNSKYSEKLQRLKWLDFKE